MMSLASLNIYIYIYIYIIVYIYRYSLLAIPYWTTLPVRTTAPISRWDLTSLSHGASRVLKNSRASHTKCSNPTAILQGP